MTHYLLINCPDEPGLVYRITEVLYRHGLNILRNGEFVDRHDHHFFMRTELEGPCEPARLLADLQTALPHATIRLRDDRPRRIVLMATKEHHCLSELLLRHFFGQLQAQVLAVISNHDNLRNLTERLGVPYHYLSAEGLSREAHEAAVLQQIDAYDPDYVVLARYMRILSPEFVAHFPARLINIHHSFLPAFVGASPYAQAYARGVKSIGATAHFVTDQLDQGPIITQSVIPTDHTHSALDMAQAGRDVEKITLARALTLVFREQVFVHRNRTIVFE
ncbi:formyltetrahydrofolate deformylase [Hymenobacter yonginensis]|uniref:Formyltetrahydrofolate deformylase n=1 Tax=Hymenobacter yonginensis TaxID=748197 RepID=A0ABY7PUM1_9BACT|nr:formyltetrahydrofolate deformylase [Hymenobacter yonginensis]WBO86549.1 formyltetrahydrofolate deformylase [Hymenobacter yonginensis]